MAQTQQYRSKLLIVDEDPYVGTYMSDLFKRDGYEVYIEEKGEKTIQLAEQVHPDLVLLDVMLTGLSGFEVCARIRAHSELHDMPVILLSSLQDRETRLKGIEAGADDFIVKPFDRAELRIRVKTITRLDRYRQLLSERERAEQIRAEEERKKQELRKKTERALRESKRKFENLAENALVGIFYTDAEGKLEYVNHRWELITKTGRKQALGKHWFIFVHQGDLEQVDKSWRAHHQAKEFTVEHRVKNLEQTRYSLTQVMPEHDIDGELRGFVGTVTDITARHKRDQAIRQAIVTTQESERKRFAEDLHDSVGQLLSATKMHLNAIPEEDVASAQRGSFLQARELLGQAIAETRTISHNLMPSGLKRFGLQDSLQAIITMLSLHYSLKIRFKHKLAHKLNEELELGIYRIVQEATNNIIKHAQASEAFVDIEDQGSFVRLAIADNGKGFDPENISSKGIGLYNLKNRVRFLSGTIMIQSEIGKGTKLEIFLPQENTI